ncbi:Fe-S cluster assembly ATPase SufC [Anaerorhabdus sp.]|uniref:Fe-S cluster assembly ATPase SufC n=2 Tax=Anaerorhabdus sp. TaxID=1872524 RepID=UPI002B1FF426|nr:Fe-S cluster assembly ATPase SufC [Anaerorhabdus sp.]MEA4874151.1 Fe-S cluster assembly ATPase SufC [Anaerorhabdus sp.]
MAELKIENLHVEIEGKEILKGVSLVIKSNEIHALMGPNGNGKSTLLAAIMGHPKYTVTEGKILLDGQDVLAMSIDERSRAGLFLAMQYPQEVPGVTNSDFLRAAINARRESPMPLFSFIKEMEKTIKDLEMKPDLAHRFLNEGFSGGEKKRNEIVQMKLLKPSIAMLDEIDSGLDVDALKIVANSVVDMQKNTDLGLIVVSHYERFYQLLKPTHAHVLVNGKIVIEGAEELVTKIDTEGYDWLYKEFDLQPVVEDKKQMPFSLGSCAASSKGKLV